MNVEESLVGFRKTRFHVAGIVVYFVSRAQRVKVKTKVTFVWARQCLVIWSFNV